jgi:hypothetical protein
MARGDRGEARRAKSGGFGAIPLGFGTDAPRGSAGSFTSAERMKDHEASNSLRHGHEGVKTGYSIDLLLLV